MTTNNEIEKPDDATLIVTRVLNAPQDLAFKTWTTPEHVKQWMCPDPDMSVQTVRMDVRVGGKYRIQMKQADGEYFTAVGEFREVKAPERLVYTWDFEKDGAGDEFGEVEGKVSQITVEFFKVGDRTKFVLTHTRFATVASRDSHAQGWGKIVASFAESVEKK